jgi:hypothetical protein
LDLNEEIKNINVELLMNIRTIIWLTVISIALGFMESSVVIYLRKIYYPGGFQFPLAPIEKSILIVEILREAATIIILSGIGILSAKTTSVKFAAFIFCFAVWDLCYYIFLWLFLGWPGSLFTWDILFLIPLPWVGPLITPCIVSITMMILALSIIYFHSKGLDPGLKLKEWLLFISGSVVIILSFTWDYGKYLQQLKLLSAMHTLTNGIVNYVPSSFNWILFLAGELVIFCGIIFFISRMYTEKNALRTV